MKRSQQDTPARKTIKLISVTTDEKDPKPVEIITEEILKISEAFRRLESSRLEKRVIILLIQDITGLSQAAINKVLTACMQIETRYIKPIKKA